MHLLTRSAHSLPGAGVWSAVHERSREHELADNVTLQEVRLAYLASCGPSAAMIRRTNASRVDGMISIIVVAEGP
jgi:hypothetical protein